MSVGETLQEFIDRKTEVLNSRVFTQVTLKLDGKEFTVYCSNIREDPFLSQNVLLERLHHSLSLEDNNPLAILQWSVPRKAVLSYRVQYVLVSDYEE